MCEWIVYLFHCGDLGRYDRVRQHAPNATCTMATANPAQTITTVFMAREISVLLATIHHRTVTSNTMYSGGSISKQEYD
ncbi:hypothetical protein EYZ11_012076 [Aspergillus tanneri]|uniref:Uncharacterized protein n=1 Tax=Aspergillus tanneri TaxID=1220188 RepID=A0A4V3UMT0_9EURO|nr:hypothetical protein EYZ11_012076 [Aspergillus tanneri]